jgi:Acetyltransferase (GNAT) family
MITIRRGKHEDIAGILKQLESFSKFYTTRRSLYPSDPEYAVAGVKVIIDNHLVYVADHVDHGIVGLIAGFITPHFFNPEIRVLAEMFWWVDVEFRNTSAGARLFAEFLNWGKENADWVTMVLEHNSPVREETLLKRGFKLQERSYIYEV